MEGHVINSSIRATILQTDTNEFALNSGSKIPQIINGGQTSFTLSRIYSENTDKAEEIFGDKEVLLKVITLLDINSDSAKLDLIDEISNATNKQTPVINADRFANEAFHIKVQQIMFERYGILYERKRGEFSDGIRDQYISGQDLIERNHFWRLYYTANGKIDIGFQKRLFQRNQFPGVNLENKIKLDRLFLAIHVFRRLRIDLDPHARIEKNLYGKVYAYIQLFLDFGLVTEPSFIDANLAQLDAKWEAFMVVQALRPGPGHRAYIDKTTGEALTSFSEYRYYRGRTFEKDLVAYFGNTKPTR